MYFNTFYLCLDDSDGRGNLREKVIASKSIVDGLITHGGHVLVGVLLDLVQ